MSKIIPFILFFVLLACQSAPKNDTAAIDENEVGTESNSEDRSDEITKPRSDANSRELISVCGTFFREVCLSGPDSPTHKLNDQGYYELDFQSHKSELKKLGIFTGNFVQKQVEIFSACSESLKKSKWTANSSEEGIEYSAPKECGFFHSAYYFNSQEYPEGFHLLNSKIDASKASTEMHFHDGKENNYRSWDGQIHLKIELRKEANGWKIWSVERIM